MGKFGITIALGISILSVLCGCIGAKAPSPMVSQPVATGEYETRKLRIYRDEMGIYGIAHIPSGISHGQKLPAVILSHELGATLDRVKPYGEELAKAGYVTVCFDFCGGGHASRSDGDLLEMSVLTEKADLEAVLAEVKGWEFVDTGSVYLMGNSQGGLVTALTAAEHQDEVRAVILIYPAFSIYDDVHRMFDSPDEIPETHSLLGLRLGQRYFRDIWPLEPYEVIQGYGKNILLIHGDRDSIVPVSYSDRLAEAVDQVEYHVLPNADHGFLAENFDRAVSYIKDFLSKNQSVSEKEAIT